MKLIRLRKFPNNILIDEVVVEKCDLTIMKTGQAKYQICFWDIKEKYIMELWTSQKGEIETMIENKFENTIKINYDNIGHLDKVTCLECDFHI